MAYELFAYVYDPSSSSHTATKTFLYVLVYIGEILVIGLLSYSMRETLKAQKAIPVKPEVVEHLVSEEERSSIYRNSSIGNQKAIETMLTNQIVTDYND